MLLLGGNLSGLKGSNTTFITLPRLPNDMKKSWLLLIIFTLLFLSLSLFPLPVSAFSLFNSAQEPYHLKLLAVEEYNSTYRGSDADIYLELKEGSGRVFLDTFPLTKMDTQISTRFAKEIACSHFKLDCDNYDFIFTIKAKANIVGGPSAGAAIAALTAIAVLDLDYDDSMTITGTINSGGIVGQVGGVKEKLEAAAGIGLKKVLVAKGSGKIKEENGETNSSLGNSTFDLIKYAKDNLSLDVVEVMDLDEVVLHLTGVALNHKNISVEENPEYKKIMGDLQNILCRRAQKLETKLKDEVELNETFQENVDQKKKLADNSTLKGDFYSAASYCFGLNVLLKEHYYQETGLSWEEINSSAQFLKSKIYSLEDKLSQQKIETISDLQTLIVVKERLDDTREQLKKITEKLSEIESLNRIESKKEMEDKEIKDKESRDEELKDKEEAYYLLSYAEERLFSAVSWMQFFAMSGKKLIFDKERLLNSCLGKISEAEERQEYVGLYIGGFNILNLEDNINAAKEASEQGEYELCLMKAIQAKGEANAVLSVLGLSEEAFPEFLESKLKATERVIAENSAEGIFPILGYSYFQYANSLKEQEKYTALIYLEYALEMSDLDIYFPPEKTLWEQLDFLSSKELKLLGEGFLLGIIIALAVGYCLRFKKRKKKSRKHK